MAKKTKTFPKLPRKAWVRRAAREFIWMLDNNDRVYEQIASDAFDFVFKRGATGATEAECEEIDAAVCEVITMVVEHLQKELKL